MAPTEHRGGLPILTFRDRDTFEQWLERQSTGAPGAWLKLAKKSAGETSLTKSGAIETIHG